MEMQEIKQDDTFTLVPGKEGIYAVWITPDMAADWLEKYNLHNRAWRGIDTTVRDMASGNWSFNGDTITFGRDGLLQDGQHRLATCVATGVTFRAIIVTGLEPQAQTTKDQGHPRDARDFLSMDRYPNARLTAAVARQVLVYGDGTINTNHARVPSTTEKLEFIKANPDLIEAVRVVQTASRRGVQCAPSMIGAAYYICRHVDDHLPEGERRSPFQAEEFYVHGLVNGLDLLEGSPVLALRRRIEQEVVRERRRLSTRNAFRFMALGWNKMRGGETNVQRLQIPPGGWGVRNSRFL